MIIGIIIQLLFIALVIFGIYRLFSRGSRKTTGEFSIRRLFQYALLFLSLVISGVGVGGLLGRVLDTSNVIAESRTDLARNLAFTVVGLPLLFGFSRWTSRVLASNPAESRSFSFSAYLTIASITSLAIGLFAAHDFLSWALGSEPYRGDSVARALVWFGIWAIHWRVSKKRSHEKELQPHLLIGSGIGLVILAVGLGGLVGNVIEKLINANDAVFVLQRTDPVTNSINTVLVGIPVWYFYWLRHSLKLTRDLMWNAYVLLAGIAVSFITAVISLSIVGYKVLVWFFGDVGGDTAAEHFFGSANAIGSAAITLAIWWYHRLILHPSDRTGVVIPRTELRRVYEYIISGISLIASALGLMMIIVAVIESVTPSELVSGSGGTNSLILAVTLLIVGSPLWWYFWRRIEHQAISNASEVASPTRRIFLLMLFGVSGLASVISVITGVFLLFDDLLNSEFSSETLRNMRYAIAILITNGAIAGYHWSIYRYERNVPVHGWGKGRKIVLVGPEDGEVVRSLRSRIGGEIELLPLAASDGKWDVDDLVALIESSDGESLLVMNEKTKLRAVEIQR